MTIDPDTGPKHKHMKHLTKFLMGGVIWDLEKILGAKMSPRFKQICIVKGCVIKGLHCIRLSTFNIQFHRAMYVPEKTLFFQSGIYCPFKIISNMISQANW